MNHVEPTYTRNVCDSTRRKEINVSFSMAISEIFTKKVTRLLVSTRLMAPSIKT